VRPASLTKRLVAKQAEKDRYIKLYAQGQLDDEELETNLLDLKNQVENLKLLIASVESDLATRETTCFGITPDVRCSKRRREHQASWSTSTRSQRLTLNGLST
jgi:hypothetical protein